MNIFQLALILFISAADSVHATDAQPVLADKAMQDRASFSDLLHPASTAPWAYSGHAARQDRVGNNAVIAQAPQEDKLNSGTDHPGSLLFASLAAIGFIARRRQGSTD